MLKLKSLPARLQCPICKMLKDDCRRLRCEHIFCRSCLLSLNIELGRLPCPKCGKIQPIYDSVLELTKMTADYVSSADYRSPFDYIDSPTSYQCNNSVIINMPQFDLTPEPQLPQSPPIRNIQIAKPHFKASSLGSPPHIHTIRPNSKNMTKTMMQPRFVHNNSETRFAAM
ncbi:hypothetical protein GJ496_003981 [Pomphorhynchus laevis]|nr:hypothetical protein GJ496_003981 [Pomphorhynchus laevis]